MEATFKKEERLRSFKEIRILLKEGKHFFHYPFRVIYSISPIENNTPNAILISVPKKFFKRAVKRNLLKRRIRESYRLNKLILKNNNLHKINFMLVYSTNEILPYNIIENKVKVILSKINLFCNENED